MGRIIPFDKKSEVPAAVMLISNIPLKKADTVIVFPGEGEHWRIGGAVDLLRNGYAETLLVTGTNEKNRKEFGSYTEEKIREEYSISKDYFNFFVQEEARHTLDQVNWALKEIKEMRIKGKPVKKVIIATAFYHLPRVFLTFLKAIENSGMEIELIPYLIASPDVFNDINLFPAEIKRIIEYQEKGDVATFQEIVEYLKRLKLKHLEADQ